MYQYNALKEKEAPLPLMLKKSEAPSYIKECNYIFIKMLSKIVLNIPKVTKCKVLLKNVSTQLCITFFIKMFK